MLLAFIGGFLLGVAVGAVVMLILMCKYGD